MEIHSPGDVTQLLLDWRNGDKEALNKLMPLVYDELRQIAKRKLQQRGLGGQHQPTTLVHEAYIRLVDQTRVEWQNLAANTIRRILIDDYRRRIADKRGGNLRALSLNDDDAALKTESLDLLALNEAIEKLSMLDAQQARITEMRFFGGMAINEISEVLSISVATVKRELRAAKAWLRLQLE
jgi:RNA polymerase sigma factor (TIGR02999 family)